jgi:glucosamine-6-phosphate deaminase
MPRHLGQNNDAAIGENMIAKIEPMRVLQFDQLQVKVYASNEQMGQAAAMDAGDVMKKAIQEHDTANVILATGNSQLSTLNALVHQNGISWSKIRFFHMDEYVGIAPDHPSGFSQFLRRRFFDLLPKKPAAFYPVPLFTSHDDPTVIKVICKEYEDFLRQYPADLCLLGIGENGHIAFNDPPYALFNDPVWVKMIKLSPESRMQQVHEGHFPDVEATPSHAITLTIPALLAAKRILVIVPEARKAAAVHATLFDPITEDLPATILRQNGHATLYLDNESSAEI